MKITKQLTPTEINGAKRSKLTESGNTVNNVLYDGNGLILEISAKTGSKSWRFKYKSPEDGKDKKLSLGKYPTVSIAKARDRAREYRETIADGICPSTQNKKDSIETKKIDDRITFRGAVDEYLGKHKGEWGDDHYTQQEKYINKYLLPILGDRVLEEIERQEITSIIMDIQGTLRNKSKTKYKHETGLRIFVIARSIFKLQSSLGRIKYNPIGDIEVKTTFKKNIVSNHAAPTEEAELKPILKAIKDNINGYFNTQMALKILPHVFLRNNTFRLTEWKHIDFDKKTWYVPAKNLKLTQDRKDDADFDMVILMSDQVIKMLKETREHTGGDKYCFPSPYHNNRPLQEATLGDALKRLGFTPDEIVPHGFRAVFGTFFSKNRKDHGLSSDAKEIALGHIRKDVYDRSNMDSDEFRDLYQWWSDYLEGLTNEK